MFKKITAVLLCMLFAAQVCAVGASAAGEKDYVISNPYAEVDWDSCKAYKTQLHSHTNASDATRPFTNMCRSTTTSTTISWRSPTTHDKQGLEQSPADRAPNETCKI